MDCEDESKTFCADRQAHIRQRGPGAPKGPFEVRSSASLSCWHLCGCGPAGALAVPIQGHRGWTGAIPLFGLPGSAFQRVVMCTPMPPSRRVAPVPESIPAGRLPSRPSTPLATLSGMATVPTEPCPIHETSLAMPQPSYTPRSFPVLSGLREQAPGVTTSARTPATRSLPGCTGDGLDCNAIVV